MLPAVSSATTHNVAAGHETLPRTSVPAMSSPALQVPAESVNTFPLASEATHWVAVAQEIPKRALLETEVGVLQEVVGVLDVITLPELSTATHIVVLGQ
jgi:hypothetical protein